MRVSKIKVNTLNQSYNVIVGKNLSNNFSKILKNNLLNYKKCLFVIDKKVPKKIVNKICQSFKNKEKFFYFFKSNEINKNFKSINKILNILLKNNFHRNDCLISIGGGITGDVSGFAASILKRGIKFINIPTTLLSQVDSSIGGKTGINNNYGKNLIGSFYQPNLVISDIDVLNSLSSREIICGYAEILKSSLLDSFKKFKYLDKNLNKIINLKEPFIANAILNSCKLKKKIVQKDETEKNLRKILNLGHTFAHAYESQLGFSNKLNHGEAVIIGIKNAVEFSNKFKILKNQSYNSIINHINKIPINKNFGELFKAKDIGKIISFMKSDKKNNSKDINLILIQNFGRIKINYQISENSLKKFLIYELNK